MSFPYTYSDKILYDGNKYELNDLKKSILKELSKKSEFISVPKDNTQTFKANSPFFKIPFSFEIDLNSDEVTYKIQLDQVLKIILIIIIFTALFSYNSLSFFFWFASLFTVLFYLLNLLIINGFLNSQISDILKSKKLSIPDKESISEEQKKWFNDKNRCPACGYFLSEIDIICPECGLRLNRNRHSIPLDTSKYQNLHVKYHFKKK